MLTGKVRDFYGGDLLQTVYKSRSDLGSFLFLFQVLIDGVHFERMDDPNRF